MLVTFALVWGTNCSKETDELKCTPTEIAENETSGTITDSDCNTYGYIVRGGKKWMTQDLKLDVPNSWCYDDDSRNCAEYGRLYNSFAAANACRQLGPGWKVPSEDDWYDLIGPYVGRIHYNRFEDPYTGYSELRPNGRSKLNLTLSGSRDVAGEFINLNKKGIYYSSTPAGFIDGENYRRGFVLTKGTPVSRGELGRGWLKRETGSCVRCVKDL